MKPLIDFINQYEIVIVCASIYTIAKTLIKLYNLTPKINMQKIANGFLVAFYILFSLLVLSIELCIQPKSIFCLKFCIVVVGFYMLLYVFEHGERHLSKIEVYYNSLAWKYKAIFARFLAITILFSSGTFIFAQALESIVNFL